MRRILVTGGAGYIGSHVCKELIKYNYEPVSYDNLSRGNIEAVKFGPFEKGDVRDSKKLCEVIDKYKPEGVIHMAALAYVRESVQQPIQYYDNNVAGTTSLIDAMKACDLDSIVFSSTCATYGIAQEIPITEEHITRPINPYGTSKLMVEKILADSDTAHGIRSVSLRYFNACGADPDGEIGELHDPETHIIPLCLMAANGETKSFKLLGSNHETRDGTPVRDYIHVSDLADAHVKALNYLLDKNKSIILNLGTGRGYSVKEVILSVESITQLNIPIKTLPGNPADPPILVASGNKAKEIIGFEPTYTGLNDIVSHAWNWHQKAKNVYASKSEI